MDNRFHHHCIERAIFPLDDTEIRYIGTDIECFPLISKTWIQPLRIRRKEVAVVHGPFLGHAADEIVNVIHQPTSFSAIGFSQLALNFAFLTLLVFVTLRLQSFVLFSLVFQILLFQ